MIDKEKRVVIPGLNWPTALAEAIAASDENTVIVVRNYSMMELALSAARRMGKAIMVEINPPPFQNKLGETFVLDAN